MDSYQDGQLSRWTVIKMDSYQGGWLSRQPVIKAASFLGGQLLRRPDSKSWILLLGYPTGLSSGYYCIFLLNINNIMINGSYYVMLPVCTMK